MDIAQPQQVGPGRYVSGGDDDGPYEDSTFFNFRTEIAGLSWQSIGPTGSGADHIWTGLDGVPIGANYIRIRLVLQARRNTPGLVSAQLWIRPHGSAKGGDNTTLAGEAYSNATPGVTWNEIRNVTEVTVPLDENRMFDANIASLSNQTANQCRLVGWGINQG